MDKIYWAGARIRSEQDKAHYVQLLQQTTDYQDTGIDRTPD